VESLTLLPADLAYRLDLWTHDTLWAQTYYIYIYKAKNIVGSEDGPIIESPNSNIEFGIF